MLKNEIRDTRVHIFALRHEIVDFVRLISTELPISVINGFFVRQNKSQSLYYHFMEAKFHKKFKWLLRDRATLTSVRPIHYYCTTPNLSLDSDGGPSLADSADVKFSFHPIAPSPSSLHHTVSLDPSSLNPSVFSACQLKDKWFINLSRHYIPCEVQALLQFGEKFCLPIIDKEKATINLLKNVECNINRLPTYVRQTVRNRSFSIINKFHSSFTHRSPIDKHFLHAFKTTKNLYLTTPTYCLRGRIRAMLRLQWIGLIICRKCRCCSGTEIHT